MEIEICNPWNGDEPQPRRIHENSRESHQVLKATGKDAERRKEVLGTYGPEDVLTDREVAGRLGHADMNAVRPRITELVDAGELVERGKVKCDVTHRKVRVTSLP